MSNKLYLLIAVLFISLISLTSCQETEGVDEYANWQSRNDEFINSIINDSIPNAEDPSLWKVYKSYKSSLPDLGTDQNYKNNPSEYIYVKVQSAGQGTNLPSPMYTDSVSVNYRGKLINGVVFDESFTSAKLDPEIATPTTFLVSGVVTGFATALQSMHVGDIWTVYIPWNLGYGSTASGSIPAFSTLIFDLNLVKIIKP